MLFSSLWWLYCYCRYKAIFQILLHEGGLIFHNTVWMYPWNNPVHMYVDRQMCFVQSAGNWRRRMVYVRCPSLFLFWLIVVVVDDDDDVLVDCLLLSDSVVVVANVVTGGCYCCCYSCSSWCFLLFLQRLMFLFVSSEVLASLESTICVESPLLVRNEDWRDSTCDFFANFEWPYLNSQQAKSVGGWLVL